MKSNIETERLYLRPFSLLDTSNYFNFISQKDVYSWLGSRTPKNKEQADAILTYFIQEFNTNEYGVYAVFTKDGGNFIGQAGFNFFKELDNIEYLYALHPAYWNKGYATEIGKVLLPEFTTAFPHKPLVAIAYSDNHRSKHVLQKLNFKQKGQKEVFNNIADYFELEQQPKRAAGL